MFAPQDQRPQGPGNYSGNEFYNYGGGYFGTSVQPGMIPSASADLGGFAGPGTRPVGNSSVSAGLSGSAPENLPANKLRLGQSSIGNTNDQGKNGVNSVNANRPGMGACYRCGVPGHGIKECKASVVCDVCAKETHITANCVMPNQPKATAMLI